MQFIQKIFSFILSLIMSLLGLTPAVEPVDAYTQLEWYAIVADEFDLTYTPKEGEKLTDEQKVVKACEEWKVIYGKYEKDAQITDVLVAESLVKAAKLEGKSKDDTAVQIANDLGIVAVEVKDGKAEAKVISKTDADAALAKVEKIRLDQLLKPVNGGTVASKDQGVVELSDLMLVENGNGLTLQTADGAVINEEDITYLDYAGSVNPFVQPEAAGINGQSILDNINVDFSVAGLDVHAGLVDGGFDAFSI